jgi:dihydrofolate reductase
MTISLVAAVSENNVIGKDNRLLWHLPNDMKFFKNTTWGMPVIMGRKTFESVDNQPLNGRTNIVVTRQDNYKAEGAVVVKSLDDAFFVVKEMDVNEVFVIGGGEIFKEIFSKADKIYLTRVHTVIEGDAFFPEVKEKDWTLGSHLDFPADEKHAYAYSFQVWIRK